MPTEDLKNMRDDSLTASVTYGDYKGTVAADGRDRNGHLADLAAKYGIDTKRFFVTGVSLRLENIGTRRHK
jgi:hypothetical protein